MVDAKFLRIHEIALELRVSNSTVYAWVASGQLRAVKFKSDDSKGHIRIPKDAYEQFVKSHETIPAEEVR